MPSALSIVHIDTGRQLRGGQEQLLALARGLRQRGHAQLLVCPADSPLAARARHEDFRLLLLPRCNPGHLRGLLGLRRRLRAGPVHVVHAHDGHAQTISYLASAGLPVRRVASRLVAFPPRHPWVHRLKYTRTCHAIIAASESVRRVLAGVGVPPERIEVITAGLDVPDELPGPDVRARVRAAWGFTEEEFVTGHLGAFTAEKGQDLAVQAAAWLAPRLPRVRVLLAGDGPLRTPLAASETLRRAGASARLLGPVENLAEFFAGLDLFIMPSRSEAWGLAALHAMAHGLPVIASNVGGLPEIVQDGQTGWLVPPGSPEALAQAIATAASDAVRLRQFGRAARERARQFSTEVTVARTEAFYYRLAGPPEAPQPGYWPAM